MTNPSPVRKHKQGGFTLIETLIYIALFGMILTGVIVSSYPLFTNTERSMASVTDEGEAAFILRKFSWAMNSATAVSVPNATTLIVDSDTFTTSGADLTLNGVPLNATRSPVSGFSVTKNAADDYVELSFIVGAKTVGPIRYYAHVDI